MLTKRDLAVKWTACAAGIALLLFAHALTLRQITLFGVRAFLPPLIVAAVASMEEETRSAVIFAIVFGLCCDVTIAAPLPCLYTLAFTAAALASSLLARSVLQPGFLCSLAATALTFAAVDALQILALRLRHGTPFAPMLLLAGKELAVSCLLLPLCHPALAFLHKKFTI